MKVNLLVVQFLILQGGERERGGGHAGGAREFSSFNTNILVAAAVPLGPQVYKGDKIDSLVTAACQYYYYFTTKGMDNKLGSVH